MKLNTDLSIRLRGAVKANLGPTSERLVQFGIAPLRKRPRKSKTTTPPPDETPEPGAPTPSTPVTKPAA